MVKIKIKYRVKPDSFLLKIKVELCRLKAQKHKKVCGKILGLCGVAHNYLPYSIEYFSLFCSLWNGALLSSISSLAKWVDSSLKHYLNWLLRQQPFPSQILEPNCPELESYLFYLVSGKAISEPQVSHL